MKPTQDLRITGIEPLIAPRALKARLPMTEAANATVVRAREELVAIIEGRDPRLLVIAGPCSVHHPPAALDYARRLRPLRQELGDRLCLLMRVYFEKPRTTVGWRGLINDPDLDGSGNIGRGLELARRLLLDLAELGVPAATELLDPIVPQYLADLVSWAAIGARTTESQTHRDLASGLSMPVGFKNSTDGNLQVAVDALVAARSPHQFLGMDQDGVTAVVKTTGNPWCHLVLRGGRRQPNYDAASVQAAVAALRGARLPVRLLVDCSHANSGKDHERQALVCRAVLAQRAAGAAHLIGVMLESDLQSGAQPIPSDPRQLVYGLSITDPCLGWEPTVALLRETHAVLGPG